MITTRLWYCPLVFPDRRHTYHRPVSNVLYLDLPTFGLKKHISQEIRIVGRFLLIPTVKIDFLQLI